MNQNKYNTDTKLEVFVFLFLIVPSMLFSYFGLQQIQLSFTKLALITIFRDLGILFLVLYFVWHNKENFSEIGLSLKRAGDEAVIGGFLFFPIFFLASVIQKALQYVGLNIPSVEVLTEPKDTIQLTLAIILVIVVAITEETIFRGYLLNRFAKISRNKYSALFLSTAVFAIGHGYEGTAGVIIVSILAIIYGMVYLWRGTLIAPMTIHFLQNSLGLVFNIYMK